MLLLDFAVGFQGSMRSLGGLHSSPLLETYLKFDFTFPLICSVSRTGLRSDICTYIEATLYESAEEELEELIEQNRGGDGLSFRYASLLLGLFMIVFCRLS